MTAEILISTHTSLESAAALPLPAISGVTYRIMCQCDDGTATAGPLPPSLTRPDISVTFIPGKGLSANRNAMLEIAQADIIILTDDDITYDRDALAMILNNLDREPDLDFLAFNCLSDGRRLLPASARRVSSARHMYLPMCCIAIKRTALGNLRFSTLAGIGAPYLEAGEDDLFVYSMIKRGLKGRYLPLTACTHPGASTGERPQTPGTLRARGAVMHIIHPRTWLPRCLRLAVTLKGDGPVSNMRHMMQGRRYARLNRKALT